MDPRPLLRNRARFYEGVGLIEMAADVEADRADDQAEQERYSPAPAVKRLGREATRDGRAHERAQEQRDALADHLP